MATDQEQTVADSTRTDPAGASGPVEPVDGASGQPRWWRRDHPTFTALSGFFTGLLFIIVVPGLFAAVLGWVFAAHTAEDLFPLVLVTLVVPLGLVVVPRTRRFGLYMLLGMVTTAVVVAGVAAAVLWYMVAHQG